MTIALRRVVAVGRPLPQLERQLRRQVLVDQLRVIRP
jgi:hypothetical protein